MDSKNRPIRPLKIVFFGTGLSGRTTSLEYIAKHPPAGYKAEFESSPQGSDPDLFCHLRPHSFVPENQSMPILSLSVRRGGLFYDQNRIKLLKGVDGILFVADSQREMLDGTVEMFACLRKSLAAFGRSLEDVPLVLLLTKRELPNSLAAPVLIDALGQSDTPCFECRGIQDPNRRKALEALLEQLQQRPPRDEAPLSSLKRKHLLTTLRHHPDMAWRLAALLQLEELRLEGMQWEHLRQSFRDALLDEDFHIRARAVEFLNRTARSPDS